MTIDTTTLDIDDSAPDPRTPSIITPAPAVAAPIKGCGWLLYTISCLALGVDPRDGDGYNSTTHAEIIAAVETIRNLRLGQDTRTESADCYAVQLHGVRVEPLPARGQRAETTIMKNYTLPVRIDLATGDTATVTAVDNLTLTLTHYTPWGGDQRELVGDVDTLVAGLRPISPAHAREILEALTAIRDDRPLVTRYWRPGLMSVPGDPVVPYLAWPPIPASA